MLQDRSSSSILPLSGPDLTPQGDSYIWPIIMESLLSKTFFRTNFIMEQPRISGNLALNISLPLLYTNLEQSTYTRQEPENQLTDYFASQLATNLTCPWTPKYSP
jgi:hypothetical protein